MPTDDHKYVVTTVKGSTIIDPDNGYVLPHEHLTIDLRTWWEGSGEWCDLDAHGEGLVPERYFEHRQRPQGTSRENMVQSDWYLLATELRQAVESGCQLLVNLTTRGLAPNHALDIKAADLAGLPMVVSVGRYIEPSLTDEERSRSVDDLATQWIHEANGGNGGAPAGIIGEIGTSATIQEAERRSLRAAAITQAETGLAINVHLHPFAAQGHPVLDILEAEGANLEKVALSHCDASVDRKLLRTLAERGAYVEFDLFGTDHNWVIDGRGFSSDSERLDAIIELTESGLGHKVLLSHDLCMKNELTRYGGWGYGHLGRRILPLLEQRTDQMVRRLLSVENPLRLLSPEVR